MVISFRSYPLSTLAMASLAASSPPAAILAIWRLLIFLSAVVIFGFFSPLLAPHLLLCLARPVPFVIYLANASRPASSGWSLAAFVLLPSPHISSAAVRSIPDMMT